MLNILMLSCDNFTGEQTFSEDNLGIGVFDDYGMSWVRLRRRLLLTPVHVVL